MRISDWSSDVCSSDLCLALKAGRESGKQRRANARNDGQHHHLDARGNHIAEYTLGQERCLVPERKRQDRKSVVEGKSVSVRVDLGGRRIIKKKNKTHRKSEITTQKI